MLLSLTATPFTTDNTEGYSRDELAVLNQRFAARLAAAETTPDAPQAEVWQRLCEDVLAEYDTERSA